MWYMHDVGWAGWLLMSVGMVAFWGLVAYVIVTIVRGGTPGRSERVGDEPPGDVLRRRLAAGEISVEEYQRLREVLEDGAPRGREPALR